MARVTKPLTGTYDGKQFILLDRVIHTDGGELDWVIAHVIEFLDGSVKYVWNHDPLLKFDSIEMGDRD